MANKMNETCSTHEGGEKCVENFSREVWKRAVGRT
jgi:hypothetical protein